MSDRHDPTTSVTDRLARLAEQPVPDAVRGAHLHRMAAAEPVGSAPKRFGRLAVAGAAIVGFFAGSTGFAMAGALPDPAQGAAHDVLSVLQVDVPDRPGNGNGPPDFILEDPCKGPPPWAIDQDMTAEERAAAQAERRDTCGADDTQGREGNGPPEGVGSGGPPQSILDDPCTGPPPWVVEDRRADPGEAEAFAELRTSEQCADDDAQSEDTQGDDTGASGLSDDTGSPESTEAPDDAGAPHDTVPPEDTGPAGDTRAPEGVGSPGG